MYVDAWHARNCALLAMPRWAHTGRESNSSSSKSVQSDTERSSGAGSAMFGVLVQSVPSPRRDEAKNTLAARCLLRPGELSPFNTAHALSTDHKFFSSGHAISRCANGLKCTHGGMKCVEVINTTDFVLRLGIPACSEQILLTHVKWFNRMSTTVLAPNFEELWLLKRYLDTQQIHLQHPTIISSCFNS